MFCGNCGKPNAEQVKFCIHCGDSLESQTPPPAADEIASGAAPLGGAASDSAGEFQTVGGMPTIAGKAPLAAAAELAAGAVIDGRYEVIRTLGAGGMGSVYLVDDKELGEYVALKFMAPELVDNEAALERFRNEARVAKRLAHENIVRTHDLGNWRGQRYITMEYVPGGDLSTVLREQQENGRPISHQRAVRIALELCRGLEHAHQHTVHRDIKPGNILLAKSGDGRTRVKLTDFGIAKLAAGAPAHTRAGHSVGTEAYMAPEQRRDAATVDARADLYSVGVVLYELLTGQLPQGRFKLPGQLRGDLPSQLDELVEACLAPAAEDRPSDAAALAARLEAILQGSGPSPPAARDRQPAENPPRPPSTVDKPPATPGGSPPRREQSPPRKASEQPPPRRAGERPPIVAPPPHAAPPVGDLPPAWPPQEYRAEATSATQPPPFRHPIPPSRSAKGDSGDGGSAGSGPLVPGGGNSSAGDSSRSKAVTAHIHFDGLWGLVDMSVAIAFDGLPLGKGSLIDGFGYTVQCTTGEHELSVRAAWGKRVYRLVFPRPGAYRIDLEYSRVMGKFSKSCRVQALAEG